MRRFRSEGVYTYVERAKTAVEKDQKLKKSVGFQPYIVSFEVIALFETFLVFIGLFRSYQM